MGQPGISVDERSWREGARQEQEEHAERRFFARGAAQHRAWLAECERTMAETLELES